MICQKTSSHRPWGSIAAVKERLTKIYPGVVWSKPNSDYGLWGTYQDRDEGYSIEFSLGKKNTVESVTFHVRGTGNVLSKIVELCNESGWKAIDTSAGEFIDLQRPSAKGWENFKAYRDRVVKQQSR